MRMGNNTKSPVKTGDEHAHEKTLMKKFMLQVSKAYFLYWPPCPTLFCSSWEALFLLRGGGFCWPFLPKR